MNEFAPKTHAEWMAVWEALTQYVENNDPEELIEPTEKQRSTYEAAVQLMGRFDSAMAHIAERDVPRAIWVRDDFGSSVEWEGSIWTPGWAEIHKGK